MRLFGRFRPLPIVGIGIAVAVAGVLGAGALVAVDQGSASASDSPSVIGQFETFTENGVTQPYYQPPSPAIGIHMMVLPTGDVLVLGAFKYNYPPWNATAYVFNPTPGAPNNGFVKEVDPPDNIFCSGVASLSDGTVVLVGGRLHDTKFAGPPLVYTFDPYNLTWTEQPSLPVGLFYPTSTELPNGSVIATSGGTESGNYNETIQVLSPGTPSLHLAQTPPIMDYDTLYPRQWVMPNGEVISYATKYGWIIDESNADPAKWTSTPIPPSKYLHDGYGPASIVLPGTTTTGSTKVIIFGGGDGNGGANNNVEELDDANLKAGWKTLAAFPGAPRVHSNAVLLPNGNVFLAGGNSQGSWNEPTHQELLYVPSTNKWTTLASNDPDINRGYHSNAVLLPDGRVLIGGDNGGEVVDGKTVSDHGGRLEIYDPPYLFKGARPTITSAPSAVTWGSTFNVATPSNISKVMLIAPADQTHSVNMNQNAVYLPFTSTAGGISLTAPSQNEAPPGYYMLFLVNSSGVPSVAAWVHVGGVAPTVTAVSPHTGPFSAGTSVTITGTGFANAVGVKFGETGASFHVDSNTQITAKSPVPETLSGSGLDVTVETATSQSAPATGDGYTYDGPYVSGLANPFAPYQGGTVAAIDGVNFASGDTVTFGGTPATSVKIVNSGTITAGVPPGVGTVPVVVTDSDGVSNPPTAKAVLDYSPSVNDGGAVDGPLAVSPPYDVSTGGGSPVTIQGSNFDGATGVTFGGTPAESFTVVSNQEIQAVPPPRPVETQYGDVVVTSPGGSSTPGPLTYFCWYEPSLGQTPAFCTNVPGDAGD